MAGKSLKRRVSSQFSQVRFKRSTMPATVPAFALARFGFSTQTATSRARFGFRYYGQRRSAAKEINPPPRGRKIRTGGRSILFPSPRVI